MNDNLAHHTLKSYDDRLAHLLELIVAMGAQVRALAQLTKRALKERSSELVAEAKQADAEVNRLEHALEQAAIETLALQNPLAIDLRFVTSALKISGVLERAGDLAKNVVKRAEKLGDYASPATIASLERMADITSDMLDEALEAFKQRDAARATAVWRRDDEVDDLYHELFTTVQQEMQANPAQVAAGTHLVFMAKNFERMADYVTNLAKTVHYVVTGKTADKSLLNE